jgi:predicted alpha/beta-fold hydrolase
LRIARKCIQEPIADLRHIFTISPLLDPAKTTERVDGIPLIRRYFLNKWRRSLEKKQQLFPHLYDFSGLLSQSTIRGLTDVLLDKYSKYGSAPEYFRGYTLLRGAVKDIQTPTTIISSEDDPIIPTEDFCQLETNEHTNLAIQRYGGHNGFVDGISLRSWFEPRMVELFDRIVDDLV